MLTDTIKTENMISIVIPALNEEKLIACCLKSLKEQTYQGEYEIIVVDNGSTDNTARIAKTFGVKVISASARKNVTYARQAGAEAALGDIIVQADADTIYPPLWLQRISDQFQKHPKAAAVAGRFDYRDKFAWAWIELFVRNLINLVFTVFFSRPLLVSGATFAFRRSAFNAAGGYEESSYSSDQYGIASRLKRYGKVLYDPHLIVTTSARSVKKTNLQLIQALSKNIYNLNIYWLKVLFIPRTRTRHPLRKQLAWSFSTLLALIIAFSAYGYFVPSASVFGDVYSEENTKERVVALTFDDGPNEPYTSQILNILKENDIKATFFVIGENVETYPETARRILAEGSVLGNHSYSHDANHALSEYGARDLERAENVIYDITGIQAHLYRPPHGKKTPWELHYLIHHEMIEVTWSATANDQHETAFWGKPTPTQYAADIVKATHPGDIILLHDGYGTVHNTSQSDKSLIVEALPRIISQLKAVGYKFVTVPELLDVPAYNETE